MIFLNKKTSHRLLNIPTLLDVTQQCTTNKLHIVYLKLLTARTLMLNYFSKIVYLYGYHSIFLKLNLKFHIENINGLLYSIVIYQYFNNRGVCHE